MQIIYGDASNVRLLMKDPKSAVYPLDEPYPVEVVAGPGAPRIAKPLIPPPSDVLRNELYGLVKVDEPDWDKVEQKAESLAAAELREEAAESTPIPIVKRSGHGWTWVVVNTTGVIAAVAGLLEHQATIMLTAFGIMGLQFVARSAKMVEAHKEESPPSWTNCI